MFEFSFGYSGRSFVPPDPGISTLTDTEGGTFVDSEGGTVASD